MVIKQLDFGFLFSEDNKNIEISPKIKFRKLIGRSFKYEFENGKTTVVLDKKYYKKISENELELLKKILLSINSALFDVIDDKTEIELILDRIDHKIKKIKW